MCIKGYDGYEYRAKAKLAKGLATKAYFLTNFDGVAMQMIAYHDGFSGRMMAQCEGGKVVIGSDGVAPIPIVGSASWFDPEYQLLAWLKRVCA